MKKLLLFFLLYSLHVTAQYKVDTIIKSVAYTSYFSNVLKEPLYVTYTLSKGGGDCDRSKFKFKTDKKIKSANANDYNGTGYDKGHLVNAEDEANNCIFDESTFRYWNCLPQTSNLNRGVWKINETDVRKISQKIPIFIVCGGYYKTKIIIGENVYVPTHCWKVVQNIQTKKIIQVKWFTNTNNATVVDLSLKQLEDSLKFKVPIL